MSPFPNLGECMPNVYVVRADFGKYADHFLKGDYVGIGWIPNKDLSNVKQRDELYPIYQRAHPNDTSKFVVGQQVNQIARFLLDIQAGDYVITPPSDTEYVRFCKIEPDPSYFYSNTDDGCPFPHRRRVSWDGRTFKRSEFSVPFQNTLRSSLTIFAVSHREEFLSRIGVKGFVKQNKVALVDPYQVVLDQILKLDAAEFEILVKHLLTALGFEGSEVTGKTGDGGVDAIGELNVSNLAKVKVFVQAKRYNLGSKISASVVRQLRQAIPFGGQGAFITTSNYQTKATDVALETGFPRIGLINGHQLVDLLIEHWGAIPEEFREGLGLRPGLVRV